MEKQYYVYILTNKQRGTLYVGVTSDLVKRVWEHKEKFVDGFSKEHDLNMLVYFEVFGDVKEAIVREKGIKKWNRDWKIQLVEAKNAEWKDLYAGLN